MYVFIKLTFKRDKEIDSYVIYQKNTITSKTKLAKKFL